MREVQILAELASLKKTDDSRHKCFVSYHVADLLEVETFVTDFGSEFIPRSVGVTEEDDFVESNDTDYIKRRIREKYLADSTVTIVLLGAGTWGRKFVDWEISSSLRNDAVNRRSGLLVLPLPSMNNSAHLPDRVGDNWVKNNEAASYAYYRSYPATLESLRTSIESAFQARSAKATLVDNSRALRQRNST
ncbi:TIR domain-containing protein [Microbacterium sp. MM2322]|uniref:TIR domain-containing protein n=1 Tax=Microbacterium sp. MM2322 TaxID=3157631 RepID=UPI0032D5B066